jgi:GT2 family glycosyltransferase
MSLEKHLIDRIQIQAEVSGPIAAVSIIIVSYNTRQMTVDCIASVLDQAHAIKQEIIMVDNNSNDGSAAEIRKRFPSVKLICSTENLGFAKANNLAARHATADLLLLLNPDTLILDQAVEKLVTFSKQHPKAGIWGGRTLFGNGSLNSTSCWRFMSLWSLFCQAAGFSRALKRSALLNSEAYGGWNRNTEREVDFVTGCFLLIKTDLWIKLHGFDETFFMYAEEADLCLRARKFGARPLVTPNAEIIHYGGASEAMRASKLEKLFAAKVTFIKKHWPVWKIWAAKFFLRLHVLLRFGVLRGLGWAGIAAAKQKSEEWKVVWQSRSRWLAGF